MAFKLAGKLTLFLSPLLAFLFYVNDVSPFGSGGGDAALSAAAVDHLDRGAGLAVNQAFNGQRVLVERLRRETAPVEIVVLGSSHGLQIGSDFFPGHALRNYSQNAGTLVEMTIAYASMRKKGILPRCAILTADAQILDSNDSDLRMYHDIIDDYRALVRDLPGFPDPFPLFSTRRWLPSRWFTALPLNRAIWVRTRRQQRLRTTANGQTDFLRPDGSYQIRKSLIEIDEPTLRDEIEAGAETLRSSRAGFNRSGQKMALFERLVALMVADGVRPVLYIPPYHPRSFALMRENPLLGDIVRCETYYRDVAARLGIEAVGALDPSRIDARPGEFYNATHPKAALDRRLLAASKTLGGL